jgi:predicted permease
VRRAVGASRGQLLQQVLCEGAILTITALIAALVAARWCLDLLRGILPEGIHGVGDLGIDGRTLVAAMAVATLSLLAFAIGPALSAWPRHALDTLRTGTLTTDSVRSRRLRQLLVVGEVTITCVLLCAAVGLTRLLFTLTAADIGVAHENALTFRLMLPTDTYGTVEAQRAVLARIERELIGTGAVQAVGITSQLPGATDGLSRTIPLLHERLPQPSDQADRFAILLTITPGYFSAAGIRLIAGRTFTDADNFFAYPVTIVSERVARVLGVAPADLVGDRLIVTGGQRGNTWSVVVGVVADVMQDGPEVQAPVVTYQPFAQRGAMRAPWIVASGRAGSQPSMSAVRAAVARVDPALPMFSIRTFKQVRADALADRRFALTMLGGFSVASFGLAAIGLYAVLTYLVQRQTREFGIRLALGASPATLRRRVLTRATLLGAAGALAGSTLTIVAARLLWAIIPGFGRIDPSTILVVSAALVTMALAAAFFPARRATRVDPVIALRSD